jgi:hypothetical protein
LLKAIVDRLQVPVEELDPILQSLAHAAAQPLPNTPAEAAPANAEWMRACQLLAV